jgi:hypothetical protein
MKNLEAWEAWAAIEALAPIEAINDAIRELYVFMFMFIFLCTSVCYDAQWLHF